MRKKLSQITALLLAAVLLLGGCGQKAGNETEGTPAQETQAASAAETTAETQKEPTTAAGTTAAEKTGASESGDAPEIAGLTYESSMELLYAKEFNVYYYEGGYGLIDVHNSARYLVVPENQPVPDSLDAAAFGSYLPGSHLRHGPF